MYFNIKMDSSCGRRTVWMLIRWLHQKPSDLNHYCFQNIVKKFSQHECNEFDFYVTLGLGWCCRGQIYFNISLVLQDE